MLSWPFAAAALLLILVPPLLAPALRPAVLAAGSIVAVTVVWKVPVVSLLGAAFVVYGLGRVLPMLGTRLQAGVVATGVALVAAYVVWAKAGGGPGEGSAVTGGAVLGLSYFSLKFVQHLVDAAAGRTGSVGIASFMACIFFLPTYPSGPIERTGEFARKLEQPSPGWRTRVRGAERILFGIGKKFLLADPLLTFAIPVYQDASMASPWTLMLAIYAYAFGMYLDFAAYSDIAIGVGGMAGVKIRENFDRPFLQPNIGALWQHWHMSLTSWLRDFVFIPVTRRALRFTRRPLPSQMFGQIVTMTLCGLWHGIAWNFAVWGLYHGVGLAVLAAWRARRGAPSPSAVRRVIATAATFHFFAVGAVFFANDMGRCALILRRLITSVG